MNNKGINDKEELNKIFEQHSRHGPSLTTLIYEKGRKINAKTIVELGVSEGVSTVTEGTILMHDTLAKGYEDVSRAINKFLESHPEWELTKISKKASML